MIVAHMDSGLGNQMLDYAEYLAIKKSNPNKEIYIETAIYELSDKKEGMISQWNGYELERIFGIKAPLLKDKVGDASWNKITDKLSNSHFWNNNWAYSQVLVDAINGEGYNLINLQKNSRDNIVAEHKYKQTKARQLLRTFFQSELGYHVKQALKRLMEDKVIKAEADKYDVFQQYDDNVYTGHSLELKYKNTGIDKIEKEIREAFVFPEITDEKNQKGIDEIRSCNSVAIHARRGDMLSQNAYCYKYGYFKKAVKFIKKRVENPVFYIFTDPGSMDWCRENGDIFALDFTKDKINFVTWNSGENSFRDLQLISECKHCIFTESSFGFWGAWLNKNPNKITIAPDPTINATNWF